MKQIIISIAFVVLSIISASAQEGCLNKEGITALDASWDRAQIELDYDYIKSFLAEDFIWAHNHANTIDDKAAVLERIQRYIDTNNRSTKARTTSDVKVIITGKTGIISGFTIVEKTKNTITYHFMRTYVEIDGNCYLVASQTMAVPDRE